MSVHRFPPILLALIAAALASPAAADPVRPAATAEVQVGSLTLEPIRVAADAEPDPVAVPTAVPANLKLATVTMPREEIERRAPFKMTEALRSLTPNLVSTRQNRKYRNFFDVRGDKCALSVDGFLVQDGSSNGGMRGDDRLLEFMDPAIVESIELVKDSSALVFGTSRGGLIRVKTRKPDRAESTRTLEIGGEGLYNARLTTMDRTEWGAYYAAIGDHRYSGPEGKNAEEKYRTLFLKLFYEPTKKDDLTLTYDRSIGSAQIPIDEPLSSGQVNPVFVANTASLVTTAANGWKYDPWTNTRFDLDWLHRHSDRQSTNLQLTRLEVENDFTNPRGNPPAPIGHINGHRVEETTTALALRHTLKFRNGAVARAGYYFDRWENPTGKLYWENRANEDEKHSYYLQGEIPLADRLTLDLGYRRDRRYIVREEKSRLAGTATTLLPLLNTWEDPRDAFSTGLVWKAGRDTTLSLRGARLEVTPVDRNAVIVGAKPLSDESDTIANFAIDHEFARVRHGLKLSLNLFRNKLDDYLTDDTSKPRYADAPANTILIRTFKNQSTTQKGGELTLTAGLGPDTDLSFGVGRLTYEPDITTKPRKNYNVNLHHRAPRDVEIDLYGVYVGPFDGSITLVTNPGPPAQRRTFAYNLGDFWDLSLAVTKKLDEETKIRLAVKNLADKRYETTVGTPSYGRLTSLAFERRF